MFDRTHRIAFCAIAATLQLAATAALAAPPGAQATWRCANNTYTDQPCANGKAVDASDARSDADRRAADAATRRTGASAEAMQRDRLHRETQAARDNSRPAIIATAPVAPAVHRQASPTSSRKKKKGGKDSEFFTAHDAAFGPAGANVASGSPAGVAGTAAAKRKSRSGA